MNKRITSNWSPLWNVLWQQVLGYMRFNIFNLSRYLTESLVNCSNDFMVWYASPWNTTLLFLIASKTVVEAIKPFWFVVWSQKITCWNSCGNYWRKPLVITFAMFNDLRPWGSDVLDDQVTLPKHLLKGLRDFFSMQAGTHFY